MVKSRKESLMFWRTRGDSGQFFSLKYFLFRILMCFFYILGSKETWSLSHPDRALYRDPVDIDHSPLADIFWWMHVALGSRTSGSSTKIFFAKATKCFSSKSQPGFQYVNWRMDIGVFYLILLICPKRGAFRSIATSSRSVNVCCCCFIPIFRKNLIKICNFGWIILELKLLPRPLSLGRLVPKQIPDV